MKRGYTLTELAVAMSIVGLVTAVTLPQWSSLLDQISVERAASELTTALAVARNEAVVRAGRARLWIASDSLRIDALEDSGWAVVRRWPGPERHGVSLSVSNPTVVFGPTGIGWGASNTKVLLRLGLHTATITTSRVGRVKRW